MDCPVCFYTENTLTLSNNCGHVISCANCLSRTLETRNNRCPEVECNSTVTSSVPVTIEHMECEYED
jgi:hypothetical protein